MKMKQESRLVSSVQSLLGMPAQESNGKSCAHLRVVSAEAASLNEVRDLNNYIMLFSHDAHFFVGERASGHTG